MRSLLALVSLVLGLLRAQHVAAFATSAPARIQSPWKTNRKFDAESLPVASHVPSRRESTTTRTSTSLQALPAALGALPLSKKIFLSCLLPSCLGFWKSEYGVSYAYGSATALTSYLIYQQLMAPAGAPSWAAWHAGALVFYGVRLCLFLACRELASQRMKDMAERIEQRAKERGGRLKRAPFVLSVAGLYFGLCAPLLISAKAASKITVPWVVNVLKGLVATTWGAFVFAALGDFTKSYVKAIEGEDHLVKGGIFSICRHPNYSGEAVAWTCNGLIAVIAAAASQGAGLTVPQLVGYLLASVTGALGLVFVVLGATKGLEKKQKESYGETEEYKAWIESTWCGFELPESAEEVIDPHVEPHIEVVDSSEETGSGI